MVSASEKISGASSVGGVSSWTQTVTSVFRFLVDRVKKIASYIFGFLMCCLPKSWGQSSVVQEDKGKCPCPSPVPPSASNHSKIVELNIEPQMVPQPSQDVAKDSRSDVIPTAERPSPSDTDPKPSVIAELGGEEAHQTFDRSRVVPESEREEGDKDSVSSEFHPEEGCGNTTSGKQLEGSVRTKGTFFGVTTVTPPLDNNTRTPVVLQDPQRVEVSTDPLLSSLIFDSSSLPLSSAAHSPEKRAADLLPQDSPELPKDLTLKTGEARKLTDGESQAASSEPKKGKGGGKQ